MFLMKAWLSMEIGNNQKPRYSYLLHGHGYQIPQFQKFCHLSYMVIITPSFKVLLSLLSLSHPTISKFVQPFTMEFFRICNPFLFFILFFLEIGRYVNYNYYC